MFTVSHATSNEIEVKGSRFITTLLPYRQFDQVLNELRSTHSKANHFVYAYRHLNEHEQIVENQTDDGEPKGSSGKPTLAVLAGNDLVNVAAITTRFFGGTKLGVGGLVRAYGDAVKQAIQAAELKPFKFLVTLKIQIEYGFFDKFAHMLGDFAVESMTKDFGASTVTCDVIVDRELAPALEEHFRENPEVAFLKPARD